jgi:hypothetical protein
MRFRLPCGGDQEAVLRVEEDRRGYELLRRCILDHGGSGLTDDELAVIAAEMEQRAPKVELELDLACPECEHRFVAPFDATAFFIAEMRTNGRQLLLEVHSLAFYYHWSEAEILGMRRGRRREYLGLLADALRGD